MSTNFVAFMIACLFLGAVGLGAAILYRYLEDKDIKEKDVAHVK